MMNPWQDLNNPAETRLSDILEVSLFMLCSMNGTWFMVDGIPTATE